jgi:hypothetical protein
MLQEKESSDSRGSLEVSTLYLRFCALEYTILHVWNMCALSQHLRSIWHAFMPSTAYQTHLERLHAVPMVSEAFGMLGRRSHPLRRIWDACTPSTAYRTRLERLHVVPMVSEAFGTLGRRSHPLRRIWDACTPSTTFGRVWKACTLFPASQTR